MSLAGIQMRMSKVQQDILITQQRLMCATTTSQQLSCRRRLYSLSMQLQRLQESYARECMAINQNSCKSYYGRPRRSTRRYY